MPKFMLIYRDPAEGMTRLSPEEMQGFLALWGEWVAKSEGAVVDGGDALHRTGRMMSHDGLVTDGPYTETKELLGGYSIVQAADYAGAEKVARDCPIRKLRCSIEIRELVGY